MTAENLDKVAQRTRSLRGLHPLLLYEEMEPYLPFYMTVPDGSLEIRPEARRVPANAGLLFRTIAGPLDRYFRRKFLIV